MKDRDASTQIQAVGHQVVEQPNLDLRLELGTAANREDRSGYLAIGDAKFPAKLFSLPTQVETYKTLDDINLIKTGDVSEVIVVYPPGSEISKGEELLDGVTPPFRNARHRHFRQLPQANRDLVQNVEDDLRLLLEGNVPKQWTICDVEEEWRVDPRTGRGTWVAVDPQSVTLIPQHVQQRSLNKGYGNRPEPRPTGPQPAPTLKDTSGAAAEQAQQEGQQPAQAQQEGQPPVQAPVEATGQPPEAPAGEEKPAVEVLQDTREQVAQPVDGEQPPVPNTAAAGEGATPQVEGSGPAAVEGGEANPEVVADEHRAGGEAAEEHAGAGDVANPGQAALVGEVQPPGGGAEVKVEVKEEPAGGAADVQGGRGDEDLLDGLG